MLPLDEKEVCALFRPAFFACSAVISGVHFGWIGNRELENRARDNPGCRVTGALPSVITSLWYRHQIKTSSEEPYLKKKKRKEKNSAENPCRSKCLPTYKLKKKKKPKKMCMLASTQLPFINPVSTWRCAHVDPATYTAPLTPTFNHKWSMQSTLWI